MQGIELEVEVEIDLSIVAVKVVNHLLAGIGESIKDIRNDKARDRCKMLEAEARILHLLLADRPGTVDLPEIADDARKCVQEIRDYTAKMKSRGSGILSNIYEIWWQNKHVVLMNWTAKLSDALKFGLFARGKFTPLDKLGPDGQLRPGPMIDLPTPNPIQFQDGNKTVGWGVVKNLGPVACREFQADKEVLDSLELYQQLQVGGYVQKFLGFARIDDRLYVVMQHFPSPKTLNTLCVSPEFPASLETRLDIASCIARAFARFYRSDDMLESASDSSIFLETLQPDGKLSPVLAGLEHMHKIYELSPRLRFDYRYQAPEYDDQKSYSLHMDRWRLDVLVWQVLCGAVPFGMQTPVGSGDKEAIQKIQEFLGDKKEPGVFPEALGLPTDLVKELRKCWSFLPEDRPTPMEVTNMLLRARIRLEDGEFGDDGGLRAAKSRAASLVGTARSKDHERETPAPQKMDASQIKSLLQGEDNVCAYLVGACVWWELLDDEALELVRGPRNTVSTVDRDRERAELALVFLQQAEKRGFKGGYLEMQRAYAFLEELYQKKHDEKA